MTKASSASWWMRRGGPDREEIDASKICPVNKGYTNNRFLPWPWDCYLSSIENTFISNGIIKENVAKSGTYSPTLSQAADISI